MLSKSPRGQWVNSWGVAVSDEISLFFNVIVWFLKMCLKSLMAKNKFKKWSSTSITMPDYVPALLGTKQSARIAATKFVSRLCRHFNTLSPGRCGSNFKVYCSNSLYITEAGALAVKLLSCESNRTSQLRIQHWLANGLVPDGTKPYHEPMLIQI